ncbi:Apoptosis-inducing factor 2 [Gaertneriomyces sp. JEL0708]|nr:Apoptosis-inducing factor 2 [Gaertneriomyces sp. JEL0708]
MTTTKIVILGGGYAGVTAAKRLDKSLGTRADVEITLVTQADCVFHNIGSMRALVEPSFAEKLFIPYTKLFAPNSHARMLQGNCVRIDQKSVVLEDGNTVPFDYLIIATGTAYPSPSKVPTTTKAEGIAHLQSVAEAVKQSENILVIGGGPVGVEIAGEIATDYPTRKVTLVHSGAALMPGPNSDKFKARLLANLQRLGVDVVLGEKVENLSELFPNPAVTGYHHGSTTVKTNKDRTISADFIVLATGNTKCNSDIAKPLGADVVDDRGQIKVRPTMQLKDESLSHIFAVGDVSDAGPKLGYLADPQAVVAVDNIVKLMGQGAAAKLKTWTAPTSHLAVVTTGRNGGVAQMGFVFGDFTVRMIKSKDMYASRYWGILNMGDEYKK